jgi:hypothetical protein
MNKLDLAAETDPEGAEMLGIVKKWLQQPAATPGLAIVGFLA